MPQEFIVTRCYSCQNFQVHQIRKDSKFTCKVCGLKQSKKKVCSCIFYVILTIRTYCLPFASNIYGASLDVKFRRVGAEILWI